MNNNNTTNNFEVAEQNLSGEKGAWLKRSPAMKMEEPKPKKKRTFKYQQIARGLRGLEPGHYADYYYETSVEATRERAHVGKAANWLGWNRGNKPDTICYKTSMFYDPTDKQYVVRVWRLPYPKSTKVFK